MRIALVEDTIDLGEAIATRFRNQGHALEWVSDGASADALLAGEHFDLVILDLMLPQLDGQQVLQRLRERGDNTPVLVLTARSQVDERVSVLDLGADDYMCKPFEMRELEARGRALLRRHSGQASGRQHYGKLTLDAAAHRLYCNDEPLFLPMREFRLLEILLSGLGRVMDKDEIADRLFGLDGDPPALNAVELYVGRLRKRLADSGVRIRTLRGMGYLAELEENTQTAADS